MNFFDVNILLCMYLCILVYHVDMLTFFPQTLSVQEASVQTVHCVVILVFHIVIYLYIYLCLQVCMQCVDRLYSRRALRVY